MRYRLVYLVLIGALAGCGVSRDAGPPPATGTGRPATPGALAAPAATSSPVPAGALPSPSRSPAATHAHAGEPFVHVSKGGGDSPSCGTGAVHCASIRQGIANALPGQTVVVHAGVYYESGLRLKSGVSLYSVDGRLAAKIYSGALSAVRFEGVDDAGLDGFEIYGDWNEGEPGDGLVRVHNASNITIRNAMLHDAPADSDVIKVSGLVSGLLLESLVVFNPGQRVDSNPCGSGPWYQENIDIYGSDGQPGQPSPVVDVTLRGSWLFHTPERGGDWLLYSKVNAQRILYENNIFGPSAGAGCGNAAVGVGTAEAGEPDPAAYVVREAIVRNNVFAGLQGDAALAVTNADQVWVYNNTFYRNGGERTRSVVALRGNARPLGTVALFNNIFQGNQPSKEGAVLYWVREGGAPAALFHDHNLYVDNLAASDLPYAGEPNSVYDADPLLAAPAIPALERPGVGRIKQLAAAFGLLPGSPAERRGLDAVGRLGHPSWRPGVTDRRWDLQGRKREVGGPWNLGA